MKASLDTVLKENGIMVIDGSMSTALEQMGADLNDKLWTAKVLAEQPELVKEVHKDYFRAGADCGITCSYQATLPGFLARGYSREESEELIRRSVRLFLEARDEWWAEEGERAGRSYPLCLAGMGPYGAYLADGSEYRGKYGVSRETLYEFHRRRTELLLEAGADLLLFETQPSLEEVLIEAEIAESLGADYWISFSCRDGSRICEGTPIRECAAALSPEKYPHLKIIGINCTEPQWIVSLIRELKACTTFPVGVYPNSGKVYDPVTKTWSGDGGAQDFGTYVRKYLSAGADAVGGCCTTTAVHIRETAEVRDRFLQAGRPAAVRP